MNIALHIEKLILDGLPVSAGQGPAFQAVIQTELTRLLEERGMWGVSGGAVPHLSVAAVQLATDGQPAQWARQIARSLYDGLAPVPTQPAGPPSRFPGSPRHTAPATFPPTQSVQTAYSSTNPSSP